ncbi:MAG: domain protein DegV family, partial [Oscillospiraceae bacterium]|nr:domain protein DegV family [Oscillospiraceae bacterium]
MQKIKIITDSACDIPKEYEKELDIQIIPFSIAVDDKSYLERVDFTNQEFYDILESSPRIPVTAHITSVQFNEIFEKSYRDGYTDVILITINSKGSNTYDAALIGKDLFYQENQEAFSKINIHIIDSLNYTLAYGYPVIEAAKKVQKGASSDEIVAFLEDWFASVEIYFAP